MGELTTIRGEVIQMSSMKIPMSAGWQLSKFAYSHAEAGYLCCQACNFPYIHSSKQADKDSGGNIKTARLRSSHIFPYSLNALWMVSHNTQQI